MKILVILGSIREGRVGDKVSDWVLEEAKKRNPEFEYEFADLKDYPMKLYSELKHPSMLNGNSSDEVANKWIAKVNEADAFLIITPEYNRGTSGALKNAIDYPFNEWHKKPLAIISYGGQSGGTRAAEQLKLNFLELRTIPTRETLAISFVASKVKEGRLEPDEHMQSGLNKTLDQLEKYTKALKKIREEL